MTKNNFFTPEQTHIMFINDIPRFVAYERITRSGWSMERAISEPIRERKDSGWAKHKHIAIKNGVQHSTYWRRWKRGFPPEACLLSLEDFREYQLLNQ